MHNSHIAMSKLLDEIQRQRDKGLVFNDNTSTAGTYVAHYSKMLKNGNHVFSNQQLRQVADILTGMREKKNKAVSKDKVKDIVSTVKPNEKLFGSCTFNKDGKCVNTGTACNSIWDEEKHRCLNETATSGHTPINPKVIELNNKMSADKDNPVALVDSANNGFTGFGPAPIKEEVQPKPEIDLVKYGQELCKKIEERDSVYSNLLTAAPLEKETLLNHEIKETFEPKTTRYFVKAENIPVEGKALFSHIWPDHKPDPRIIPPGRYEVSAAPKELHLKGKIHCDEESNLLYLEYAEILDIARYCLRKNATLEITIREEA